MLYDNNVKLMNIREGGTRAQGRGGAGGKNTGNDNEKLMNINKGEERTQEMMMKNL
jgi:hypothetical protein